MTHRGSSKCIVILGPGYVEIGGAQNRLRLLSAGLAEKGWSVKIIGRAGTLRRPRFIHAGRVSALDLPGWRHRFGAVVYLVVAPLVAAPWAMKARVIVAMQLGSQTLVAAVCSAVFRRKFLVMLTSSGAFGELSIFSGRFGAVRRWALRRASLLLVQTVSAADEASMYIPRDRIRVLPNPVPVRESAPDLNGEPRVIFTGRFSEEKDLLNLLRAWKLILSDIADARLILAGEGGHYRSVEGEIRSMIESDSSLSLAVELPGWVDDAAGLLEFCDVAVIPSLSEGMSNSLLEAYATGRVIVASDIPQNVEVVGSDYELLYRPGDVAGLARVLTLALTDEDVRRRARERALSGRWRFEQGVVIRRFEELIGEALTGSRD